MLNKCSRRHEMTWPTFARQAQMVTLGLCIRTKNPGVARDTAYTLSPKADRHFPVHKILNQLPKSMHKQQTPNSGSHKSHCYKIQQAFALTVLQYVHLFASLKWEKQNSAYCWLSPKDHPSL